MLRSLTDTGTAVRTTTLLPNEVISPSNIKLWLRTWSNDISSGVNYINDNFTLTFQTQTGTVSITSGTATITGSGTNFTSADVGKRIRISGQDRWIISVASTTSATINTVWINEGNWTSSASGVAYSYGYVSAWKDKSGGGFNFTQATNSRMPLLILDKNKIRVYSPRLIDSSGQYLQNTSFDDVYLNGTSYCVYTSCIPMTYAFDDANNFIQSVFSHRYNNIHLLYIGNGSTSINFLGFNITNSNAGTNYFGGVFNVPNILSTQLVSCGYVNVSANSLSVFNAHRKSTVSYTGTLQGVEAGSGAMLFACRTSGGPYAYGLKGYINEVIVSNAIPSDIEVRNVLNYIEKRNEY